MIDFPWSFWRLIGRQDRTYCIDKLYLYDQRHVLWTLTMAKEVQCVDVQMPIRIGSPQAGFIAGGRSPMEPGVRYGVAISGIGNARVDFVMPANRDSQPINVADWDELMEPPCGTYFSDTCDAKTETMPR